MRHFPVGVIGIMSLAMNAWAQLSIPGPPPDAPVVHIGRYHVLTSGRTSVVLDGAKGMSFVLIGERGEEHPDSLTRSVLESSLQIDIKVNGRTIALNQANDPAPRLQIIAQSALFVAARTFFSLCSSDGRAYGTGTMDIYLRQGSVHIVPSAFIDDVDGATNITRAGFQMALPPGSRAVEAGGRNVPLTGPAWSDRFGDAPAGYRLCVEQERGRVLDVGCVRTRYPPFIYLREIDRNPATDELYERWPLWITQRGSPLGWNIDSTSCAAVSLSSGRPSSLSMLWLSGAGYHVTPGGYAAFNATLVIGLGRIKAEADAIWESVSRPLVPAVGSGDFRFFNEIEGIYEIDSQGRDVSLTFDGAGLQGDRPLLVRLWNLTGKGGYEFQANGKTLPSALMNDGGIVEDPMVFVVRNATGPARSAIVSLVVPKGGKITLSERRKPGLQLTYQMYSDLETYEAWSDPCGDRPLFLFHLKDLAIYHATLPGAKEYAFFRLPLYFMKNGVNPATFINQLRSFAVTCNGPDSIELAIRSVNIEATGLSSYTCRVPNDPAKLSFDIAAAFVPLDDGRRWTSLEYCDLYPFEGVYRRDFHFGDVTYLSPEGLFGRVPTGSWSQMFRTVTEKDRPGYYSEVVTRVGPGSRVPPSDAGSIWLLGDNPGRGNILFRRGHAGLSSQSQAAFSLCNAWMDVHNVIAGRAGTNTGEKVTYAIEIFPGPVPSLDALNSMYRRDVGRNASVGIRGVRYSARGGIVGFDPAR